MREASSSKVTFLANPACKPPAPRVLRQGLRIVADAKEVRIQTPASCEIHA